MTAVLPTDDIERFTRVCPTCHTPLDELGESLSCPRGHTRTNDRGRRVWEVWDTNPDRDCRAALVVDTRDDVYVWWEPVYLDALNPLLRSQGPFAVPKRYKLRAA